jgi:pimeloyl-ACP methyl ester carboxylesterase
VSLLLVHGAGAHRQWWYRVVPALAAECRVITIDASGHGNSGRRTTYGVETFARDIVAVVQHVSDGGPLVVAGHSAGGRWAGVANSLMPGAASRLVVMDSQFPPVDLGRRTVGRQRAMRYYPSRDAARRNFRLVPKQPEPAEEFLEPVFDYSVLSTDSGWCWKADTKTMTYREDALVLEHFANLDLPITYAYGALSSLRPEFTVEAFSSIRPDAEMIRIEGGYHHLPLDSPQQCIDVLRDAVRDEAQ